MCSCHRDSKPHTESCRAAKRRYELRQYWADSFVAALRRREDYNFKLMEKTYGQPKEG